MTLAGMSPNMDSSAPAANCWATKTKALMDKSHFMPGGILDHEKGFIPPPPFPQSGTTDENLPSANREVVGSFVFFHFRPVFSGFQVRDEWNAQLYGIFHFLLYEGGRL